MFIEYHQDWTQSSGSIRKQLSYAIISVTISLDNVGLVRGFPNGFGTLQGELYPGTHILLKVLHFFLPSQQRL